MSRTRSIGIAGGSHGCGSFAGHVGAGPGDEPGGGEHQKRTDEDGDRPDKPAVQAVPEFGFMARL